MCTDLEIQRPEVACIEIMSGNSEAGKTMGDNRRSIPPVTLHVVTPHILPAFELPSQSVVIISELSVHEQYCP